MRKRGVSKDRFEKKGVRGGDKHLWGGTSVSSNTLSQVIWSSWRII